MSDQNEIGSLLPDPSWLPLHRALFYYFPHFVRPGEGFAHELSTLIKRLTKQSIEITASGGDCVFIDRGDLRLIVDAKSGTFEIQSISNADDWSFCVTKSMDADPRGLPSAFFEQLAETDFKPLFKADGDVLRTIALQAWAALQRRFYSALSDGSARIYGRWKLIDAPFARVSTDQWIQFVDLQFDEVEVPIAEDYEVRSSLHGRQGETIYSLYAANSRPLVRSKGTGPETDAILALAAELRDNPENPRSKAMMKADYTKRFRVSANSFEKVVWPAAADMVPSSNARRPGRRKKEVGSEQGSNVKALRSRNA